MVEDCPREPKRGLSGPVANRGRGFRRSVDRLQFQPFLRQVMHGGHQGKQVFAVIVLRSREQGFSVGYFQQFAMAQDAEAVAPLPDNRQVVADEQDGQVQFFLQVIRSEERRVGTECGSTCRCWWSLYL